MGIVMDDYAAGLAASAAASTWVALADAVRRGLGALGAGGVAVGVAQGARVSQTAYGFEPRLAESYADLAADAPLPGPACLRSRTGVYLEDRRSTTDTFPAAAPILDGSPFEAAVCLPLLTDEGRPLGYIAGHYRGGRRFERAEMQLLETMAATCAGTAARLSAEAGRTALTAPPTDRVEELTRDLDGLRTAMATRGIIEQAKGILMERYGLSSEAAWQVLRRLSSHSNTKLRDLATCIVDGEPVEQLDGRLIAGLSGPRDGSRRS